MNFAFAETDEVVVKSNVCVAITLLRPLKDAPR